VSRACVRESEIHGLSFACHSVIQKGGISISVLLQNRQVQWCDDISSRCGDDVTTRSRDHGGRRAYQRHHCSPSVKCLDTAAAAPADDGVDNL